MADRCLYEPIHGHYPECDGACKKGPDKYCQYYFVDECCAIIRKWKAEARVDEPVLIKEDNRKKKLIIYSTRPGFLIGKAGERYYKYRELLRPIMAQRFVDHNGIPTLDENFIEFVECNDAI